MHYLIVNIKIISANAHFNEIATKTTQIALIS